MLKIRKFELQDKALPFCAAQKVGDEGVETALAATVRDREDLTNETSDLVYHLRVRHQK